MFEFNIKINSQLKNSKSNQIRENMSFKVIHSKKFKLKLGPFEIKYSETESILLLSNSNNTKKYS